MKNKDYYIVEKNVEKFIREGYTNFLDMSLFNRVKSKLKGLKYKVYYPYKESERVIIYKERKPKIRFLEIISFDPLRHSEIMGSLYGTNIDKEYFGDIVIYDNHYYVMVMNKIYNMVLKEFTMVGNKIIRLKEVSNMVLDDYVRSYDTIEITLPNIRIDCVISKLLNIKRDRVKNKIANGEVILNYEVCYKNSYVLRENDIFSIRKYGKYRFDCVIKETRKDKYVVRIYKYTFNI